MLMVLPYSPFSQAIKKFSFFYSLALKTANLILELLVTINSFSADAFYVKTLRFFSKFLF